MNFWFCQWAPTSSEKETGQSVYNQGWDDWMAGKRLLLPKHVRPSSSAESCLKNLRKLSNYLRRKSKIKNRLSNCSRIWSSKMRRDFKVLRQFFSVRFKKNRSPLSQLFKQKWRVTRLSSLALYWTTGGPAGDEAWSDMNFICGALKHSNGLSNTIVLPAKLDKRHEDPLPASSTRDESI